MQVAGRSARILRGEPVTVPSQEGMSTVNKHFSLGFLRAGRAGKLTSQQGRRELRSPVVSKTPSDTNIIQPLLPDMGLSTCPP